MHQPAPARDGGWEANSAKEGRPEISLIVAVDAVDGGTRRSIEAMQAVVHDAPVEVIVASREPIADAPSGVTVVVYDVPSRGDRYDRAVERARGSLLAFSEIRMRLPADWAQRVLDAFANPAISVAGGPVLPRSWWRGERVSALILNRHVGATPVGHLNRPEPAAEVTELAGSNLVIRRDVFRAVGGFQSPSVGGEAVRLCYKVRAILERPITYLPALAVSATARRFPGPFLGDIASFGRARGDLARRYRELAPLLPYGLPTLTVALAATELALVALRRWDAAIVCGAVLLVAYLVQAVRMIFGPGRWTDRLLAAGGLPLVPLTYGSAFVRGFLGPSQSEVSHRGGDRRPRVLIINWRDITNPQAGGAEVYMHEIGRRWSDQGIEVRWLCRRYPRSLKYETVDGIAVQRVGGRFTLYLMAPLAYLRHLRGRFDVIIDCENGIPFFTPLYSRTPRVLLVHHVHSEIFRRETRPPLRWIGLFLERRLMPRVYRKSPVVAVSESTRDDLVAIGFRPERITVVHNGVRSVPAVPPQPAEQPRIVYVGRLTPQKCVDVLIKAMPDVLRAFPDARLDIVGQGPDRMRLERLAWTLKLAHHVRFHGYLSAMERDELIALAWVAVCPSAFEGWGVSCVEASARGVPVVASNVNGLRDAVRDGETGVLVPHGDSAALAAVVVDLLADPERRGQMGAAGWRWAALHSWDRSASAMQSVVAGYPGFGPRTPPVAWSPQLHDVPAAAAALDASLPRVS